MPDLFDRLFPPTPAGIGPGKIGVHDFRAACGDYAAGHTTRAEIIAFWDLDEDAQTDLNALCDAIDGKNAAQRVQFILELHDVMLIAESKVKYHTKAAFRQRLGL